MSATSKDFAASTEYFTCTLGEAVGLSHDRDDVQSVNDFIDHQAKAYPNDIAVGFPVPGEEYLDWAYEVFCTFCVTPILLLFAVC